MGASRSRRFGTIAQRHSQFLPAELSLETDDQPCYPSAPEVCRRFRRTGPPVCQPVAGSGILTFVVW